MIASTFIPEIDLDDARIGLHLLHVAFGRTRPSCSTVTRFAIDRTKSMSCSTTMTVCSAISDSRSAAVRSVFLRRHARNGLVTSSSSGSCISSMPISSHCFCRATARLQRGAALIRQADKVEDRR